jgi:urea transport system ATP-binding protein
LPNFLHLTVEENLEMGLSGLTGRRQIAGAIPDNFYELFPKLEQIAARKGGLLSGGE